MSHKILFRYIYKDKIKLKEITVDNKEYIMKLTHERRTLKMINIIEHGYKFNMETRCPHCGCRFSFGWEDVLKSKPYTIINYSYYTENWFDYKIKCPECSNLIPIFNGNWPITTLTDNGITITTTTTTWKKEKKND